MKSPRYLLIAMLAILLNACGAMPAAQAATTTFIVPSSAPEATETALPTASPEPTATATDVPRPPVTRVVIISMDGLRPDAIDMAPMPALQNLMATGAYSLAAQTIDPSTTLPANTSMLSSLCPSAHGLTWDEYLPERGSAPRSIGMVILRVSPEAPSPAECRRIAELGRDYLQQGEGLRDHLSSVARTRYERTRFLANCLPLGGRAREIMPELQ